MSDYKKFAVTFYLDEREQKALEELLPFYQNYIAEDGSRPCSEWTIENVFQSVMELGSTHIIAKKIQEMQFRQELITWDQMVENGFKTMEERRNDGTGRNDAGAGKTETP